MKEKSKKKIAYLYYSDIRDLDEETKSALLPDWRKEKAAAFSFKQDKQRSIGAWLLLKKALKLHRIDADSYPVSFSKNGKPVLENCPYGFSIAHSGEYVLVGLYRGEIGVDLEKIRDVDETLISRITTPEELGELKRRKDDDFFDVWTRKEAGAKLQGDGVGKMKGVSLVKPTKDGGYYFYTSDEIDGYKISCCVKEESVCKLRKLRL